MTHRFPAANFRIRARESGPEVVFALGDDNFVQAMKFACPPCGEPPSADDFYRN
jgi:hypothetical protein